MELERDTRSQHKHPNGSNNAHDPRYGLCLRCWGTKQYVFQRAAHRSIRHFLSKAAPAQAISNPVATYIVAATANAAMPTAESLAILETSAVSSRPGKGTCDA